MNALQTQALQMTRRFTLLQDSTKLRLSPRHTTLQRPQLVLHGLSSHQIHTPDQVTSHQIALNHSMLLYITSDDVT